MEKANYFQEENELIKKLINLDELLSFQLTHNIEILRGADWQYECYINGKCWYIALTPIGALVLGVHTYKKHDRSTEKTNK